MMINPSPHTSQEISEEVVALIEAEEEEEEKRVVNVGGVLSAGQLVILTVLIVLSVSLVWVQTGSFRQHQKQLGMYFNFHLLALEYNGLYEDGDNQDEMYNEFFTFGEMQTVLMNMVNVTNLYAEDGVVLFQLTDNQPIVKIEPVYLNDSIGLLEFYSVQQALDYFQNFQVNATRKFLLGLQKFLLTARLGDSKFANNYQIMAQFAVHHGLMLDCDISYEYEQIGSHISTRIAGLRFLGQLTAGVLLLLFLLRMLEVRQKMKKCHENTERRVLEKYRNWYAFLGACNCILMVSSAWAPLCAWLQLLPLFQFPDQPDEGQMYNFNKNIRYSLPLILRIWLPLLLCLNGFVYFSMLLYADSYASYFGDYFLALFDYLYQMFQVGTYEIFIEMQQYGYAADILYCFLYFYVFQMGTTLIPAFFVTLIQLKLNERDVKRFSAQLLKNAVCPYCNSKNNLPSSDRTIRIQVTSPKLSPLVKEKKLLHSPKSSLNSIKSKDSEKEQDKKREPQLVSLFISHEDNLSDEKMERNKMSGKFVRYAKKCKQLLREMERRVSNERDKRELEVMLEAIRNYRFVVGGWSGPQRG